MSRSSSNSSDVQEEKYGYPTPEAEHDVVYWVCCSLACALDPEMLRRGAEVAWSQGEREDDPNRSSERIRIKTSAIGN